MAIKHCTVTLGSTQPSDYLLEGKKEGIPRKQAHSKRLKPWGFNPTPTLHFTPYLPKEIPRQLPLSVLTFLWIRHICYSFSSQRVGKASAKTPRTKSHEFVL